MRLSVKGFDEPEGRAGERRPREWRGWMKRDMGGGLPLYFVCPIGGGELAFGDVGCVTGFERSAAFGVGGRFAFLGRGAGDSLLAETDGFGFVADLGDHDVGFSRVGRGAFWGVDGREVKFFEDGLNTGCHMGGCLGYA